MCYSPSYNENDRITSISGLTYYYGAYLRDVPDPDTKNTPCRIIQSRNMGFIHLSVKSLQKVSFNE